MGARTFPSPLRRQLPVALALVDRLVDDDYDTYRLHVTSPMMNDPVHDNVSAYPLSNCHIRRPTAEKKLFARNEIFSERNAKP